MVLFILEKNIDSDTFIKECLSRYIELSKKMNLEVKEECLNEENFLDKVKINRDTKPYLTIDDKKIDIYFNISHTDGAMVALFSNEEVGVDIEKIKERNFKKVAKRENIECSSLDEFIAKWTQCEAYIKLKNMHLTDISKNKEFDFSIVKTIDILKNYYISFAPNKETIIIIL